MYLKLLMGINRYTIEVDWTFWFAIPFLLDFEEVNNVLTLYAQLLGSQHFHTYFPLPSSINLNA